MNHISVRIQCKGSGIGQIQEIYPIIEALKEHYVIKLTLDGRPQANGVVDTIIEVFLNTSLTDFIEIVRDGMIWYAVTSGGRKYVLDPLIKAFNAIEKNPSWDYTRVTLAFEDSSVVVNGWSKIFTSAIPNIVNLLLLHYDNLRHTDYGFPEVVVIPLQYDKESDNYYDGDSYEVNGTEEYCTFWGLQYSMNVKRVVYDLKQQAVLDIEWT